MSQLLMKTTSAVSALAIIASSMSSVLVASADSNSLLPYADALANAGIISTQSDSTAYRLNDSITRAEMAKIAVNIKKVTVAPATGKVFSDVSSTNLGDLANYIEAAASVGIVSKSNATFRPLDLVTRAEMVKMLLVATGVPPSSTNEGFTDIATIGDLAGYINAAAAAGIINKATMFNPSNTATRGEAFKVAAISAGLATAGSTTTNTTGTGTGTGTDLGLDLGSLFGTGTTTTTTTTTSTGTTSTSTTTTTGAINTSVPTGTVAVSLSPTTPASQTAIAGAAFTPFTDVNFTAGASDVTVTQLAVTKLGYVSDQSFNNIYLFDVNGNMLAQTSSISQGKAKFINSNGIFTVKAGTTMTLRISGDVQSGVSSGLGVGFGINAATDITSTATVAGTFPISGNLASTASVSSPNIATLSGATQSVATQVNAGTKGFIAGAFSLTAQNSPVALKKIKFTQIGSINSSKDVANLQLQVNGSVVATAAGLNPDGTVVFNLAGSGASASGVMIPSGTTTTLNVLVDVMGGPTRYMQFTINNNYDIQAVDTNYNVGILATTGGALQNSQIQVQGGSLTVTKDAASPSGNSTVSNGLVLSTFDVTANGEDIKLLTVPVNITTVTGVSNLRLVVDNGDQIGSTVNTPTGTTPVNAFGAGTSTTNVNYVIPANTTRKVSIVADLSTTSFVATSIQANLGAVTAQGVVSNASTTTSTVTGSPLSLTSSSFSASLNNSLGSISTLSGAANVRVASFTLTAGPTEDMRLTSVSVSLSGASSNLQNLKAYINGTQYGQTYSTFGTSVVFSSSVTIPKSTSVTFDVFADVLSSASFGSNSFVTLSNANANGVVTGTTRTLSSTVIGQTVSLGNGATVVISSSSATPSSAVYPMNAGGSSGINLASFTLTNNGSEGASINTLPVYDSGITTAAGRTAFYNLSIYNGGTQLATANSLVASGTTNVFTGSYVSFSLSSPLVIPANGTVTLTLKGFVSPYNNGQNAAGTVHNFELIPAGFVAVGQSTGANVTSITGTGTANQITILRTNLTAALASSSPAGVRVVSSTDNVATYSFTADQSYNATLSGVYIKLSGTSLPSAGGTAVTVNIVDPDNAGVVVGTKATTVTVVSGTNGVFVPFTSAYTIAAGSTKNFQVQVDTTGFQTGSGGSYKTLQVGVIGYVFNDGVANQDTTGFGISPNASNPLNSNTLQY